MFHSRNIRECLIELFAYPRWLAVEQIDVARCPHKGYFDRRDGKCWKCLLAPECQWVNSDNDGEALTEKSTGELIEALDVAVNFVEDHRRDHNRNDCDCDNCLWLRETRNLLKQYRTKKLARKISHPTKGADTGATDA